jgi:hypothetical protein
VGLLLLALAVAPASAQLICLDGDADADTICDGVDNCPADANTDQSDVDGDSVGDVCDPVDRDMFQSKVKIKANMLGLLGQARSYFQLAPPATTVDVSNGFSVTIRDGGAATVPASWSAGDCIAGNASIRCFSPDRTARLVLKASSSEPGLYRLRARVKDPAMVASFLAPATVELTIGDLTYQDVATICVAKPRGLTCRYPPP